MAYGLDGSITLGPQNEKRFLELVEYFEQAQAKLEELRTLLATRQQEQTQHALAMATVNIETDPTQLGQGYQLRDAQSEVIRVIEAKVAEAKKRKDAARDAIDRFVGNCNSIASSARTWRQRGDHAYAEADKLLDQLNQ